MNLRLMMWLFAATFGLALATPAFAQDDEDEDEDDALEDILNEEKEETVEDEVEDVKRGDIDDRPGVKSDTIILPEEETGKRRLIKVLQRKWFLKINRFELGPYVGFVTNDPFINRYIAGFGAAYHFTEVFAGELSGSFSPDFGQGDWKPITDQLVNKNKVSPDISKIIWYAAANFQFSPIYGKIAVMGRTIINFDIFGVFGMGVVGTRDDLEALQAVGSPSAEATQSQVHPTTNFGGGFRIIFSKFMSARVEGRSLIYIETIDSTTLEYKNNFMLQGGVTFFVPGMK